MLKATDSRNLPMPYKVALRTRDKVAQSRNELLCWIQNLNPALHTENWRVLGRQSEPKGQRLILHIDQDSLVAIQKTEYKIFTGVSQGTVKVLRDPEKKKKKKHHAQHPENRSLREREMKYLLPQMAKKEQQGQGRRLLLTANPPRQTRGPF
jgi:hypothetical protein